MARRDCSTRTPHAARESNSCSATRQRDAPVQRAGATRVPGASAAAPLTPRQSVARNASSAAFTAPGASCCTQCPAFGMIVVPRKSSRYAPGAA